MARSFGEMILVISISVILGLGFNLVYPKGIPFFGKWDPKEGSVNAGGPCVPSIAEVREEEIAAIFIDEKTVFIDARSGEDYAAGHIPRAVSFPVKEFEAMITEFETLHPLDTPLLCYCSGIDCEDSHLLAEKLEQYGYTNTRVYARGYEGWVSENRPVEKDPKNE